MLLSRESPRGPFLVRFFFYINDLPTIFNNSIIWVLFADDTSPVISCDDNIQYRDEVNSSFIHLNAWFSSNSLTLNFNRTKHRPSVKFSGTVIENSSIWKAHISQHMPKLCEVCYSMRVIKTIMPSATLKMVYYTYFHSLLSYGIIFWGDYCYSMHIFWIQKRIIGVMRGLRPRNSCRDASRDWVILPLQSQYIFYLLIFVVNNKGLYSTTTQIHGFNTRHKFDLYHLQANLTIHQRGHYYFGH
jgi:hypothetical protein